MGLTHMLVLCKCLFIIIETILTIFYFFSEEIKYIMTEVTCLYYTVPGCVVGSVGFNWISSVNLVVGGSCKVYIFSFTTVFKTELR